jgi:hypothetical protein
VDEEAPLPVRSLRARLRLLSVLRVLSIPPCTSQHHMKQSEPLFCSL